MDYNHKVEWIYGIQPVRELLIAGRRHIHEAVLVVREKTRRELDELQSFLLRRKIPFRCVKRDEMDSLSNGGNHQGIALRVGSFPYSSIDEVIHKVCQDTQAIVMVLDHIEDPQNVGSLLRTADAVGVSAVLVPKDRAAGITPAVVRASAGAAEHMMIARVTNLVHTIEKLKNENMWFAGLEFTEGAKLYTDINMLGRFGIVIGSEGFGLSRLVRENCDFIAYIPMNGKISSLNAGIAGAVMLYEILKQRSFIKNSKMSN
jgi:23S rRNA (guanosine2251-2'-O)-methyltransferase